MGKAVSDLVLDAALGIIDNATIQTVCSAQPTTRAEAVTTFALADVAMAPADFTIADGNVNGRKVTMAAKSAVPVDTTGTGNHVALCDGTNLLLVTTCTAQALTAGNTVNFPSWRDEIADPT